MCEVDELRVYRGRDVFLTDKLVISQPTLDDIEFFGEQRYFNAVYNLTSVGADLKWQLWDLYDTDYTTIQDYDLFIKVIYQLVSSKKYVYNELMLHPDKYKNEIMELTEDDLKNMLYNPLQLILKEKISNKALLNEITKNHDATGEYVDDYGNKYSELKMNQLNEEYKRNPLSYTYLPVDLADYKVMQRESNGQIILYNEIHDIVIDRLVYSRLVDVVRKVHGLKRNNQIPANERTKMDLIEDARDEAMASANKPFKSVVLPLLSYLKVKNGKCGDDMIWNMRIGELLYDIRRSTKIQDATLLLQGAYSGFASLKEVDNKRLDMFGSLD